MSLDDDEPLPAWFWKLVMRLFLLFVGLAVTLAAMAPEPERQAVAGPISDKPALLVFESASCVWCRRFRTNVAPHYERSHLETLAPLKYVDLGAASRTSAGYRLSGRIMATPTFVLVDRSGREIERLRGLPGDRDEFMLVVERMLDRVPQSAKN
jgi:thioredoxin-related protein